MSRNRPDKTGKQNPNYKHGKTLVIVFCETCSKKLNKKAFFYGTKKCKSCTQLGKRRTKAFKQTRSGSLNPNWRGGISRVTYPWYFNETLKFKIRIRDHCLCRNCGISEIKHINKFNRNLDIHHIDYNKENCKDSNLITLCCKCNTQANFNRDYWFAFYTYKMENKI